MRYLKYKVTNNDTDVGHTIASDFNIASIVCRLELYHGSNLLEQIHEYGLLVNLRHHICANLASFPSTGNLLEGQSTNGTSRKGEAIAGAGGSRIFCILLFSGIVGVIHSKYFPTGDMAAGDLRLELTLASATDGAVAADAVPLYTISDVGMRIGYTDLAFDASSMVSQSNSGGYMMSFDSFANLASSIETC